MKVYLVWRHGEKTSLEGIFAPRKGETEKDAKERAKKFSDEQSSAWGEDYEEDIYWEVEGRETD